MDKKQIVKLHDYGENVFTESLTLERDSKERELLFYASQLIEIAIEIMEDELNG